MAWSSAMSGQVSTTATNLTSAAGSILDVAAVSASYTTPGYRKSNSPSWRDSYFLLDYLPWTTWSVRAWSVLHTLEVSCLVALGTNAWFSVWSFLVKLEVYFLASLWQTRISYLVLDRFHVFCMVYLGQTGGFLLHLFVSDWRLSSPFWADWRLSAWLLGVYPLDVLEVSIWSLLPLLWNFHCASLVFSWILSIYSPSSTYSPSSIYLGEPEKRIPETS